MRWREVQRASPSCPTAIFGLLVELLATDEHACPLAIHIGEVESDSVELFPGRNGAVYEFWPKLTGKLEEVERIVAAIVAGCYEEWFEPGSDPEKLIATAQTDDGPRTMSRNVLRRRPPEGWQHERYAPY